MAETPHEGADGGAEIIELDFQKERLIRDPAVHRSPPESQSPDAAHPHFIDDGDDWLTGDAIPQRDWLIPGIMPLGRIGLLTGEGGLGKSRLALQIAAAIASGDTDWLPGTGIKTDGEPRTVVYVTYEDEKAELFRRIASIGFDDPASQFGGRLRRLRQAGDLWGPAPESSGHTSTLGSEREALTAIKDYCCERDACLLIIDTLGGAFLSNENDRGLVTQFCGNLDTWGQNNGVTVMLISHPPKSGGAYSGSTAWRGSVRWLMYASRAELHPAKGKGENRTPAVLWPALSMDKSNYGIEHASPKWWFSTDRQRGMKLEGKATVVSKAEAKRIHNGLGAEPEYEAAEYEAPPEHMF